jgi:DNA-binding response OmpR family regulator
MNKTSLIAVLDNPESVGFEHVNGLMDAGYKVDYVTSLGNYDLVTTSKKKYNGIVILNLEKSESFPESWGNKLDIIREARKNKIPVIALSAESEETNIGARDLGAVVLERPDADSEGIKKTTLEIVNQLKTLG